MTRLLLSTIALASAASCIDDPQDRVAIELSVAGTAIDAPFPVAGGWAVDLETAQLAFGPLYLCAGAQAGTLCDSARAQWLDSVVVDALSSEPADAGVLDAVTGPVRSFMYDLGIASLLTHQAPVPLDAAVQLDGSSVRLIGTATRGADAVPFIAELAIRQEEGTERGVSVVRSSAGDGFAHDITTSDERLIARLDPAPWLSAVAFDRFVQDAPCAAGGPAVVCAGTVEQTCADDGQLIASRDCADEAQICAPDLGCVTRVRFAPDSQALRAIRNQVVAGQRPSFEFVSF